jgi:hypothetical protein
MLENVLVTWIIILGSIFGCSNIPMGSPPETSFAPETSSARVRGGVKNFVKWYVCYIDASDI